MNVKELISHLENINSDYKVFLGYEENKNLVIAEVKESINVVSDDYIILVNKS